MMRCRGRAVRWIERSAARWCLATLAPVARGATDPPTTAKSARGFPLPSGGPADNRATGVRARKTARYEHGGVRLPPLRPAPPRAAFRGKEYIGGTNAARTVDPEAD